MWVDADDLPTFASMNDHEAPLRHADKKPGVGEPGNEHWLHGLTPPPHDGIEPPEAVGLPVGVGRGTRNHPQRAVTAAERSATNIGEARIEP
jgi:hypothetical protein